MTVRNKRVVITGATGGLGPSLAEAFLAMGAHVIGVARRRTALDELRASLQHHERLDVAECDATDPQGIERLFTSVETKAPVDAVVHAVGRFSMAELTETTPEEIEALARTNFVSTALVLRSALRRMEPRGAGSIVAVAADRALAPAGQFAAYGAAKAAVTHLVQAAAQETHGRGVRINALLPGVMDTPGNRQAMPQADRSGWTDPAAVARSAVWLAGDDAIGVSGALLQLPGV
jgi:NAD(P)-dependent dehydrogenase (short-subunit alcohol dehydrogenase family)